MTLSGATIPGQSRPSSIGNEWVLLIPQSSSITKTSPSDCLVSYPGQSIGGEVLPQSLYSTVPANWARFFLKIQVSLNKFPDFFLYGHFYWEYTHETLVAFEVISSGCNALVLPFQQLLEGPMEIVLCERVNDFHHSLFHLLNCLIMTASGLKEKPKVTGTKVRTIRRLRNCIDAHLAQIVCDQDGVVDWCIVLAEMPLTRFEECCPLPKESLDELP